MFVEHTEVTSEVSWVERQEEGVEEAAEVVEQQSR
jgi:hypothetical protein